MRDLSLPGAQSEAMGINDRGAVVGWSTNLSVPNGPMHAVLWQGGVTIDLNPPGALASEAIGINNAGDIVGWYALSDGIEHAAVWRNGVMTDLGLDDAQSRSQALAINDRGDIVGYRNYGVSVPFLLEKGKAVLTLGWGYASAINNRGEVAMIAYPYTHYWKGKFDNPPQISPRAINESGQMAGACYEPSTTSYFTCIVDGSEVINLGQFIAMGLNNRGDAAGIMTVNLKSRATLWRRQ
jgi:probable HAF family extracellular repeat protein